MLAIQGGGLVVAAAPSSYDSATSTGDPQSAPLKRWRKPMKLPRHMPAVDRSSGKTVAILEGISVGPASILGGFFGSPAFQQLAFQIAHPISGTLANPL